MFYGQSVTQTYPKESRNASVNSSAAEAAGGVWPAPCSGLAALASGSLSCFLGDGHCCRFLLKGARQRSGEKAGACCRGVLSIFPQARENEFLFLLCLRQLPAGFDHYQQYHTLSLDVSKGGTLVDPELAFCPSSKFLCQSSVLRNEE